MRVVVVTEKEHETTSELKRSCKEFESKDLEIDILYSSPGEELPKPQLYGDYLISFRCWHIFSKNELSNFIEAVNIHPGPPRYRGSGASVRAILNADETFGVTVHKIDARIDGGPILNYIEFPVDKDFSAQRLSNIASWLGVLQVIFMLREIATELSFPAFVRSQIDNYEGPKWVKEVSNRASIANMTRISIDDPVGLTLKKLKITYNTNYQVNVDSRKNK